MREQKVAKVTVSLPKELLNLADRLARERSTTRSGVIAELLQREEEARIQALMAEGYREMADENRRFAAETLPLVGEGIRRGIQWDERSDG
ncbi:MAG: CopG family transcriptional regulator [Chloroflexi bacterium]|nr:CopG family transcriptional regulator [Chloroflexota bacterium]